MFSDSKGSKILHNMEFIELTINITSEEQGEILTAMLADYPFEAFDCADGQLRAYVQRSDYEECRAEVEQLLREWQVEFHAQCVEQQNWNAEWESEWEPVDVAGERPLRIRAAHHTPARDGGHIYTLGPLRGSEISYNYLTGTESRYGAIYPDSGSSEFEIHHNVVEGCEHWFFGGLYETHDITAYDNYSDTSVYYDYGNEEEFGENFIEKVNLVADDNWPKEAADIINNAGLSANYKHLAETLSYPSWRTDFAKSAPAFVFKVYDDTW